MEFYGILCYFFVKYNALEFIYIHLLKSAISY